MQSNFCGGLVLHSCSKLELAIFHLRKLVVYLFAGLLCEICRGTSKITYKFVGQKLQYQPKPWLLKSAGSKICLTSCGADEFCRMDKN